MSTLQGEGSLWKMPTPWNISLLFPHNCHELGMYGKETYIAATAEY
jgi:hypothetical protein